VPAEPADIPDHAPEYGELAQQRLGLELDLPIDTETSRPSLTSDKNDYVKYDSRGSPALASPRAHRRIPYSGVAAGTIAPTQLNGYKRAIRGVPA
jgi:hypothetical protein